jgi:hypothetical protein
MRHRSALLNWILGCAAALLLLNFAQSAAHAQSITLDSWDWAIDRGGLVPTGGINQLTLRQGYNDFLNAANDAGTGDRKWIFPRTDELSINAFGPGIVDNPDPLRTLATPFPPQPLNAGTNFTPGVAVNTAVVNATTWTIVPPADRTAGGGYSYDTDTTQYDTNDYAAAFATHSDFNVARQNSTTPATAAELAQMPNAPYNVYSAVNQALIASVTANLPTAVWTSGALDRNPKSLSNNGLAGNYAVDLHSPGDGTLVDDGTGNLTVHPNVTRAFVRVSWGANINDPTTSRIFLVDLGPQGWTRIQGGGLGPAEFPYDGNSLHPLTVTLYSLTPDNIADTSIYLTPPLVTADAVRFTRLTALGPLGERNGRILGPAAGAKIMVNGTPTPYYFFAREETAPDTTIRSTTNPTLPVSGGNVAIADPTATTTVPVFYCVDNQGNTDAMGNQISSLSKTRWQYVGVADNSGTTSASPLIANVRCRDGNVRSILYFVTTSADGTLGHIYALDPVGGAAKQTTAYWIYPSYRPSAVTTVGGYNVAAIENQYLDPNYNISLLAAGPQGVIAAARAAANLPPSFGVDTLDTALPGDVVRYDGDITQSGAFLLLKANTQTPTFGGMQSSPIVINDPANPTGAQLLVLGNMNGRVYAFDAGGRGDFNPDPTKNLSGTTLRIWTWPQLGGDAYRLLAAGGNANAIVPADVPAAGAFPASPSFDPNFTDPLSKTDPILIGSADGHLYGLDPTRDKLRYVYNGVPVFVQRLDWLFPNSNSTLGAALSTAAIYNNHVYFTSGGRVYSLPETPPSGGNTLPQLNSVSSLFGGWVYPATDNPPYTSTNPPNTNSTDPNLTTVALSPGFNGTAPIVIDGATIDSSNAALPTGVCYVLQGDGTLLALNAAATGNLRQIGETTLIASGTSLTGASTSSTPILAHLTGQTGLDTTAHPSVVFGDNDGAIYALNADPIAPGGVGPVNFLEVLWAHQETTDSRVAAPMLANHIILQGDEGGQMRAYGPGLDTSGNDEPPEYSLGPNRVSVDLRGVDFYSTPDFNSFMLLPTDPNYANIGTPNSAFGYAKQPRIGYNGTVTGTIVTDWGFTLQVAAWGVYHAQNTNPGDATIGQPNVTVTFTLSQPGAPSQTYNVAVPATAVNNPLGGLMPDDLGVTSGDHSSLSILGLDNTNAQQTFTGPSQGTYPWVAKIRIPINPNQPGSYSPGMFGYTLTAVARVTQTLNPGTTQQQVFNSQSNTLQAGQTDKTGLNGANYATRDNAGLQGTQRNIFIANPLSLTARGGGSDLTGQPNAIGWAAQDASKFANAQELGNYNQLVDPNTGSALSVKGIFAPLGSEPDANSVTFLGTDNSGNQVQPLYVMDRGALSLLTGKAMTVRVYAQPMLFRGGPGTVMNPLPWEQMPTDVLSTLDYPSIPLNSMNVSVNGQNAINGEVPLLSPQPNIDGDPTDRLPQATQAQFTVSIPQYQPANVNRGAKLVNGKQTGEQYTDPISGQIFGASADTTPILGPINVVSGNPPTAGGPGVFPAGGYISQIAFVAQPLTGTQPLQLFQPSQVYADAANLGLGIQTSSAAIRYMGAGLTVQPDLKMQIAEQTIDFGKLPHGTGYADTANGGSQFAPTWVGPYTGATSPWDDATKYGSFFRPFTLQNMGNVNMVNVRIAKLRGYPGDAVNTQSLSNFPPNNVAPSARLVSDQVDNLMSLPLFALPFGNTGAAGNLGIVSSLDHSSTNSGSYAENNLWQQNLTTQGLNNPEVHSDGVTAAGLGVNNDGWADGIQPRPVAIKAHVGDTQGPTMMVPAQPHDEADPNVLAFFHKPEVGVAVPIGTPIGTYSNQIFAFEDNTPDQWRDWLTFSGAGVSLGVNNDGILNVDPLDTNPNTAGPVEAYTSPTFTLKLTVRESRLTGGVTNGTLPQIDPFNPTGPLTLGANLLATAYREAVLSGQNNTEADIHLIWTTDRQPGNGAVLNGLPTAEAPYSLAYSTLPSFLEQLNTSGNPNNIFYFPDHQFAQRGNDITAPAAQWWSPPTLFPGYDNNGLPANLVGLFPSTPQTSGVPEVPGTPAPDTTKYASPAVAQAILSNGNLDNTETWLFWQGNVDKARILGTAQAITQQDSRTFYAKLVNGVPQLVNNAPLSFLNDPALTKLGPKPLVVELAANGNIPAQNIMYLFWYAGNQGQTSLYYNFNADASGAFAPTTWSQDQKLPTPGALVWQSDPYPVYRQVPGPLTPTGRQTLDVIDVVYTGVLKNRQTVEVLLTRYLINRDSTQGPVGQLSVVQLPAVQDETLTRVGTTSTWTARDAAWFLGAASIPGTIQIKLLKNGTGAPTLINARNGNANVSQSGQLDTASGLVYYNSGLGGQMVIDIRSGTVSFPNVPPGSADLLTASYTPQVMRLNASRDETNILRESGYGNFAANDPAFLPHPASTAAGDNMNPIALLDRGTNARISLVSPPVLFTANHTVANSLPNPPAIPVDRLWVLYRKSDVSGSVKSSIYYKAMRLMVRLPRPVLLSTPNAQGIQQFANLQVNGNIGPYEVDWVRGRIYFTEADEGNAISVQYTGDQNGSPINSGVLNYVVAWGDEISSTLQPPNPAAPYADLTSPEVIMPTDSTVNEGQVTAFKDPFTSKLWVFWTSTRSNSTDLFYQTLAPQFYTSPVGEH